MRQLLPRGFQIGENKRVTKRIAGGSDWEIYESNQGTYILVATAALHDRWVSEFSLPSGLFQQVYAPDLYALASSGNYLVASLDQGPYPENGLQVEAFSIALNTASKLFPQMVLDSALYIEEFSLLLPTRFAEGSLDAKTAYGKWLSGGVTISVDSFGRLTKLMSWLPEDALKAYVTAAGFDIPVVPEEESTKVQDDVYVEEPAKESVETATLKGEFSLIGRPELETFFRDNIIDIVLNLEAYKRMGINFPGATILHGPPGCGKTYAVEKLGEYLGWKRFDIDASSIASSYIHETSKKISEVFKSAIDAAPSILVIDEMEAFLSDRARVTTGTHHTEEVAEFLRRIPEAISKGVLVFAMTNMIDAIDPAVLRRGRFDHIVEVKMATAEEIDCLLKMRFKELPVDETVNPQSVSKALDGHPMSDVAFVLREAGRFAVKRKLSFISQECLDAAIDLLPKKKEKPRIGFANN